MGKKYTFLFYNAYGMMLPEAMRIKAEGHTIFYYKSAGMETGRNDTGVGLLAKKEMISDPWEVISNTPKDELIILIDDNGTGYLSDFLRKSGYHVVAGGHFADQMEFERSLGIKIAQKVGLQSPPTEFFSSIDEGITFLKSQKPDARFYFKPEGGDFAGGAKTYGGKNVKDLIDFMRWIKENGVEKHYTISKFGLQTFVDGFTADYSFYFDGEKAMEGSICIDIEEKKAGDNNLGVATGCMGNIILFLDKSKFFDMYCKPLLPLLKQMGFIGQLAFNCIFDTKGKPWFLEITPRCGWDAHSTELSMMEQSGKSIADFYIALAEKKKYPFPKGFGCGVRAYTGSVDLAECDARGRYFSFDKKVEKYIWLHGASYKNNAYVVEDNNPVLVVNTYSKDLQKAIDGAYKVMDTIRLPDIYYRMEIGKRAPEVLRHLHKFGWL